MKYRPEIDGLRALAVVPVIFFHAGFSLFSGGFVGVDVFFVISGYLITTIIMKEMAQGDFSLTRFYERRARRILPALFLVVLASFPFAWYCLSPSELKDFSNSLVGVATFSSNILFWRESGYFDTAAELKPLLHTWSLAVEEQYYIFFPVLLLLIQKFCNRLLVFLLFIISFGSLLLANWAVDKYPSGAFFLLPMRAWELMIGVFCAIYLIRGEWNLPKLFYNVASLIGLLSIVMAILFFDESTPTPSYYTLLPTIGTALIILFTRAETLTFKLLSFKPAVSIGLISYSAYLWHQPVLAFARYYLIDSLTTLVLSLLCCLSFIMAYFSWRYVEKPFRRGTRFNQNRVLWVSSASLIFLGALGSYGNISNGFYDNRVEYPVVVNSELLKLAGEDRQKAIRAGECHFNRLGKYTDIDSFIDNWQCHSSSKSDDVSNILVFGDSHSADKALALRKNGLEVTQLGGAACVIAPDYVSQDRRYCSKLFSKAEELAKSNQLSGVFVSNRFIESELTLPYLEAIFEYWGAWDVPVFIFSPMPDFYLQIREFKLHGTTNISPSFSREEKFFSLLKHSSIPSNIEIVKTSELWCKDLSPSLERPCSVANQFSILMTNRDHVSTEGARVMGEQILVNPKLKSVVGNINSQFPTSN